MNLLIAGAADCYLMFGFLVSILFRCFPHFHWACIFLAGKQFFVACLMSLLGLYHVADVYPACFTFSVFLLRPCYMWLWWSRLGFPFVLGFSLGGSFSELRSQNSSVMLGEAPPHAPLGVTFCPSAAPQAFSSPSECGPPRPSGTRRVSSWSAFSFHLAALVMIWVSEHFADGFKDPSILWGIIFDLIG